RRLQGLVQPAPYRKRYRFIPLSQISPNLQHAVVAAEDGRFYQHHGFDWQQIEKAANQDMEGGRTRGASTITQQLVKNLFSEPAARSCARAQKPHWCRWPNSYWASSGSWSS